jgi:hypothetical protein
MPECTRAKKALGFCHTHYARWHTHGNVNIDRPAPTEELPPPCDRGVCTGVWRVDWCNAHYRKRLRLTKAQQRYEAQLALPQVLPEVAVCKHCKVNPVPKFSASSFCSRECRKAAAPPCPFPECENKVRDIGLCSGHAHQKRAGRPLKPLVKAQAPHSSLARDEAVRVNVFEAGWSGIL